MTKLRSSRSNPCQVCGDTSGDCRVERDSSMLFCHDWIYDDPGLVNGWKYIKPTSNEVWGIFVPAQDRLFDFQASKQKHARKQKQRAAKLENALDRNNRNVAIRQLHQHLGLTRAHQDRLKQRGLTPEQIEKGLFFSLGYYPKVPQGIPLNLPGMHWRGDRLNNPYKSGFACPAFDYQGRVIGWQVRLDGVEKNKYRWALGKKADESKEENKIPSDLPNGEKPITVIRQSPGSTTLFVSEGILKPYIAANRHQIDIMGASGANFRNSPLQTKEIIESGNYDTLAICPDAGDVLNQSVMTRWRTQIEFLRNFGLKIVVVWWGQFDKQDGRDIDEFSNIKQNSSIKYLTPEEFIAIGDRFSDELWQQWINNRKFTADTKVNQRYFTHELPAENTIFAINSDMGTGKTTQLVSWIKELEKQYGVISLGYRNTLLYQYTEKTGSYHIHEQEARMMIADERSKIALCVDSLLKFEPEDFNNKVIILDELTSVIRHLLTSVTITPQNRQRIIYLFGEAIKRANRVIVLDGNMRDWAVDYIADFAPDKRAIKIENTYQNNKDREIIFYQGAKTKKGKVNRRDLSAIRTKILESVRPIIVLDNQTEAESLDNILSSYGYDTLRVDSTTSGSDEVKEFLADCNSYIQTYQPQAVILSPSAESGVDISLENYFTDIFVLAFGTIGVDGIRQMATRLRDKNAQMHLWANSNPRLPREHETINQLADNVSAYIRSLLQLEDKDEALKTISEMFDAAVQKQSNGIEGVLFNSNYVEKLNYLDCIDIAFAEAGFVIKSTIDDTNSAINKLFAESKKAIHLEHSTAIYNAPNIPLSQLNYPLKFNATPEDKFARIKAQIRKQLPGIENTHIWHDEFIYHTQFKHRDYLPKINTLYLFQHHEIAQLLSSKSLHEIARQLFLDECVSLWQFKQRGLTVLKLRETGIQNIINASAGKEYTGQSPEIIAIHKKLRRSPQLRKNLGIQNLSKSSIYNVNRLLNHLGKRLVSSFKRINGKAVRVYSLKSSKLDAVYFPTCYELCAQRWQNWIENEMENLAHNIKNNSEKVGYNETVKMLDLSRLASVTQVHDYLYKSTAISVSPEEVGRHKHKIVKALKDLKAKILKNGFQEGGEPNNLKLIVGSHQNSATALQDVLLWLKGDWEGFIKSIQGLSDFFVYQALNLIYYWLKLSLKKNYI